MTHKLTTSLPALLQGSDDTAFRQMLHDTLAFAARLEEIRAQFGAYIGLPGSAYTVLITIAHHQGEDGVGVSAVADHLHLTGAAVTIEVNRLVKLGMVHKQTNPDDRRRVLLAITPLARAALDALTEVQVPANDALFACLDSNRFAQFAAIMSDLVRCSDDSLALLGRLVRKPAA